MGIIFNENFEIRFHWKVIAAVLTLLAVITVFEKLGSYSSGDAAEIVKLYIEQSDDKYAIETRENLEFFRRNDSLFLNVIARFPDGTPVVEAMGNSMITAVFELQMIGIESELPDVVGFPKTLGGLGFNLFKTSFKIKSEDKKFGKIRLNKGETTIINGYFKGVDVSDRAFISCSYNSNLLKLKGNRTFEAMDKGETEIGILYYDGKETYIEKVKVRIK